MALSADPRSYYGFAALMSIITLFISQQASYLRLIEKRLNNLCGKEYFIWETKYADQSLRRDRVFLFSPMISTIYILLALSLVLATAVSGCKAYYYVKADYPEWTVWFIVYAVASFLSVAIFPITNKVIRNKCKKFNETIE